MSQGKRAPNGVCDYCMNAPAIEGLNDGSEACAACLPEQRPVVIGDRRRRTVMPLAFAAALGVSTLNPSSRPRYSTATKYDPCPCGSGKKFKFCCMSK